MHHQMVSRKSALLAIDARFKWPTICDPGHWEKYLG
jgi:hypothetical protein